NFLNITAGATSIDPNTFITMDATSTTFAGGNYSYRIASGAGDQSSLSITDASLFTFVGLGATPTNVSLTGDSGGSIYMNFATTPVPEPMLLGLAALGLMALRFRLAR